MKQIKLFSIIACSLLMNGCMWQTANNTDLRKAEYFCSGVENISEIDIHFTGNEVVLCIDGRSSQISKINIKEEGI